MVQRIVERFAPSRIVLFGSQVTGEATPDSDVDLLVVLPVNGSKLRLAIDIRKVLRGFGVAKDIVVLTPEEFSAQKDIPGTIAYPAHHEGHVLHAV